MKAFTFRLETLLHLRERAKDQAIKDYALSISKREQAELSLRKAVQNLKSSNEEIKQRRAAGFVGFEQDGFNQSIVQLKEDIIGLNSKVAESKNIESAKRKIYLTADSNCKSLLNMVVLNYDELFKPKPEIKAEFSSVEFDADDTSYSPAETHSMNQLSKELAALKQKLLDKENDLDSRESAIAMDLEALEKQKKELNQIREDLSDRLADFESRQGQDLSEEKLKEYKDTSKRWVEMGPEVASMEIQNWRQKRRFEEALTIFGRQKRRFEEALTIFELLKAEDKAPIISFMLSSDEDSLIELADALAMRDRGLLPNLSLGEPAN